MDDARIAELTTEVLEDLRGPRAAAPGAITSSLEARVTALEATVRSLRPTTPQMVAVVARKTHPSQELLGPAAGGDRCVLEPDQPCVGSGQCRTFGH